MEEKQQHPICEHCGFDERTRNNIHQLPLGSILRCQYLIGRVLGQGGFGITYLAWDVDLDMPVAIKEYFPTGLVTRDISANTSVSSCQGEDSLSYEETKKRFLREGKALAKFSHLSHVVRILSLFRENNTAYLVMEYLQGQTLQQYLEQHGPLSYSQVVGLLEPLMEDLQTIHKSGIIHRDISPDNIMLTRQGQVKLLDFGTVKQVEDSGSGLSRSTEAILKQGFAPLEQYNTKGSMGPWTDVYALCATICYCLSKTLPPDAPERVFADAPDRFIEELPITEPQKDVLRKGMSLRPSDRTASISALLEQLKAAVSQEPSRQQAPETEVPRTEKLKPEAPEAELPRMEKLKPEAPEAEVPCTEKLKVEAPEAEVPKNDSARREPPIEDPPDQSDRRHPSWLIPACIGGGLLAVVLVLILVLFPGARAPEPLDDALVTEAPRASAVAAAPKDRTLKGAYNKQKSEYVFGSRIRKDSIVSIEFLDSLDTAPADALDVSQSGSGKVLMWTSPAPHGRNQVTIAAEGKVILPENSSYLFGGIENEDSTRTYSSLNAFWTNHAVDTSNVTNMGGMFRGCSALNRLDLSSFDTANVTDMSSMFWDCAALTSLDLSSFDTANVTQMYGMFRNCAALTDLDLSPFNTAIVTDMSGMFFHCEALTSLNLSSFDTANVTDMYSMFSGCKRLASLDLSSFDTTNVTQMYGIFSSCEALTGLNLSSFDTANVTDMRRMFSSCSALKRLFLSSFDTANATDMEEMFSGCEALTSLDLSSFDTANVTNMSSMFYDCAALTSLDLSSFDTANVTNMGEMFTGCEALTSLDLSGFDTANVTNMFSMFSGCAALTSLDLSGFDTSNILIMWDMFSQINPQVTVITDNQDVAALAAEGKS